MNRPTQRATCAALLALALLACRPGTPPPEEPPVNPMPPGPVANPSATTPQPQATPTSGGEASHES
jgi:hypothetical protein